MHIICTTSTKVSVGFAVSDVCYSWRDLHSSWISLPYSLLLPLFLLFNLTLSLFTSPLLFFPPLPLVFTSPLLFSSPSFSFPLFSPPLLYSPLTFPLFGCQMPSSTAANSHPFLPLSIPVLFSTLPSSPFHCLPHPSTLAFPHTPAPLLFSSSLPSHLLHNLCVLSLFSDCQFNLSKHIFVCLCDVCGCVHVWVCV